MKALVKPAIVLGLAGAMALGTMTVSQARGGHHHGWAAGAAGFAVGAAVGAAASSSYYGPGYYGYYGGPGYAYTGDPAYASYGYGYDAYAYAPGYRGYGYDASTQSAPAHVDPDYGYNSNTLSPWQDRKLQGNDY